jgi:hypothetical protein
MTMPSTPPADALSDLTARAVETFSQWADANQRILRELADLSAATAREGVRLYAEMQSSAVEVLKEGQAYLVRRQDERSAAAGDPLGFYQKSVLESVDSFQRTLKLIEDTGQAMARSAERLRVTAERTGQEIQTTVTQLAGTIQSLYTPLA